MTSADVDSARAKTGRPTKAAAAERDERLLEIATAMFMEHGFDATSMDKLAEAAAIGKATLYARYSDKAALFVAVLHRRILQVYGPLEEEFGRASSGADLEETLTRIANRLIAQSLTDSSVALGRILSSQANRFPDLARLAVTEGFGRQLKLVETVLARFAGDPRYDLDDLPQTADMFLALVFGRTIRFKIYGLPLDPAELKRRTAAAIRLFVRGVTV